MNFIKKQYALSFAFFRRHLAKRFVCCLLAFLLLSAGCCLVLQRNQQQAADIFQYFRNMVEQSGVVDESGQISMWQLFLNNLQATCVAAAFGIVPFLFLAALPLAVNAAVIGGVLALVGLQGGVSIWGTVLLGLVPHGIFEIPAIMLGCAGGLYLCHSLNAAILHKADAPRLEEVLPQLLRMLLTLAVPLLLVAAAIETYVTPLLMQLL